MSLYGVGYAGHPRLANLVAKNKISALDFLNGEEEAIAFIKGEYVKLHQSTLRKVDILANIAERTNDGTLRTNARIHEIYGGYFAAFKELMREHWIFSLLGLMGAIASIVALVLYLNARGSG